MSNQYNTVLYTGMTNDLSRRVSEHQQAVGGSFTGKYRIYKLVYYELFDDARSAIAREKQIKAGSRRKKTELISGFNREWKDLSTALG